MRSVILAVVLVASSLLGCASGPSEAAPLPAGANPRCPVMNEPVDSGLYTEYRGRNVFFCCENCRREFDERPDYYYERAYPDAD